MGPDGNTLIFGAGAIGQWLGALLHSTGTDVTLHVRPRVAECIRDQGGIILDGAAPLDLKLSTTLEELQGRHFSTVISTVKTYAVTAALEEIKASRLTFEQLVSFQNGWGTDESYLDFFPEAQVWALTTTRAVGSERPGNLSPSSKGGLALAPWSPNLREQIPECLKKVKIPLVVLDRGIDLKWSKLLLNLMGNATGAVTGLSPQHLAEHPRLMKAELLLVREAIAVGNAMGVQRSDLPGFRVKSLSTALEKLPLTLMAPIIAAKMKRARGDKLPSLFFDLENPTSPTEIDALNGAVVREGERLGLPTPKQKGLLDLFHRCRRDQELWSQIRREPIRLLEYV